MTIVEQTTQAGLSELAFQSTGEPDTYECVDWTGSRFESIDIGAWAEALVYHWAKANDKIVENAEDSVFDWRVDGRRIEVKAGRVRRPSSPYYRFFAVYPHTLDTLFLAAIDPDRVRLFELSAAGAERALGARHILTLTGALRAGAQLIYEAEIPRA